jgi:hypothetical protein
LRPATVGRRPFRAPVRYRSPLGSRIPASACTTPVARSAAFKLARGQWPEASDERWPMGGVRVRVYGEEALRGGARVAQKKGAAVM